MTLHDDTQHNKLSVIVLNQNVVTFSVVILSVLLLSATMIIVIRLGVIVPIVMALCGLV